MNIFIPKYVQLYFILQVCLMVFYSCNVINPTEAIPSLLEIDKVIVESNYETEGSALQAISDVWVFANPEGSEGSDLLGVFPLPATIPILEEGVTSLTIQAGIKLNNQTVNRSIYPFFRSNQQSIDLVAGETVKLNPIVTYKPPAQIRFDLINDFELSNDFVSLSDSIQLELSSDENLVFEGNKSLTLQLDTNQTGFIITTINSFKVQTNSDNLSEELPIGDRQTYLEMHYKNDATLFVSLFIDNEPLPFNILKIGAKDEWSKIYIPLKDILAASNATYVKLAFEGFKPDSLNTARFSWDNIKIVHELI